MSNNGTDSETSPPPTGADGNAWGDTAVVVHDISEGGTIEGVGVVHVVHAGNHNFDTEFGRLRAHLTQQPESSRTVPLNFETANKFPHIYALASGETQWTGATFSCIAAFVNSGTKVGYCFECEVGR